MPSERDGPLAVYLWSLNLSHSRCADPTTSIMPRRDWTPEESRAQLPPRAEHSPHDARSHKRHHRSHHSRSPRRDNDSHRHKRTRTRSRSPAREPIDLPYKARPLSKRQYDEYRPLFQSYLDIQKHIQLDELDEREAKGRWKSFVSRWYAWILCGKKNMAKECCSDVLGIMES